jgi:hypothetical protein
MEDLNPVLHDLEATGPARVIVHAPLDDGTEIMRFPVGVTGPEPHVELHGDVPVEVAFGEELTRRDDLVGIRNYVRDLLHTFELVLRDWWALRPWDPHVTMLGP